MRVAFKEWEIVVDALGRGEQILLLRKGGIQEGRGGFRPDHRRFLLVPTHYHQQRESEVATAQARFDEMQRRPLSAEVFRVGFAAEVLEAHRLENLSQAKALRGQHIWRDEVIEQRFEWSREKAIYVLAVRVFHLAAAVELPMDPAYGGCKSWITLERDIATDGAAPVLNEAAFERKLAEFHTALKPVGASEDQVLARADYQPKRSCATLSCW